MKGDCNMKNKKKLNKQIKYAIQCNNGINTSKNKKLLVTTKAKREARPFMAAYT